MPKRVLHTQKLCRNMQQGGCKDVLMAFMSRCLASFPLSMILEPSEELLNPVIPQVVLYKQLLTNRAASFRDDSSKVKAHSVWKATTLTEEGNSKSYQ